MAGPYPLLKLFFLDPEADVLAIRTRAIALITEGKTIMEATGNGGKSSRKQFTLPPDQIVFECNAALKFLNPAVYGRRRRRVFSRISNRDGLSYGA